MFYVEDETSVEEGDNLIGLEAMKVLFDLKAPCTGTVRLRCQLGQVVAKRTAVAVVN